MLFEKENTDQRRNLEHNHARATKIQVGEIAFPLSGSSGSHYANAPQPLRLADRLEGKLLIIQGANNINTPMASMMLMIDALVRADKRFDLILLPGEAHVPSERVQPYLGKAIRGYFAEHLKP